MKFDLSLLFVAGLGYLTLLLGIAYASEKGWFSEKLARHPIVFILSLGVYTGAWAFFGTLELAYQYGYGFLAYYLGTASLFLFAPLIMVPLLRLCRLYQLSSLADLLAFRYRSQAAGVIVTITMLLALMPLLALQIQAVSDAIHLLSDDHLDFIVSNEQPKGVAFIFCVVIAIFALLFGARQTSSQASNNGLVVAVAVNSLVKLLVLITLGLASVYGVFGGFAGMEQWLLDHSTHLHRLHSPMQAGATRTLLLIFFSSAIVLPHMFHMVFAENPRSDALQTASWGFPLFLLLIALPILPMLWAGLELQPQVSAQYYPLLLGASLETPWLSALAYVGSVSAASGTIIVITLALASMCLNHLVLPIYQPGTQLNIYHWLLWVKRILVTAIITAAYLFFHFLEENSDLSGLGFAAFSASLQFLPGLMAVLYWAPANRIGFICGLSAGYLIWFVTLLLPILSDSIPSYLPLLNNLLGANSDNFWSLATLFSLGVNLCIFGLVSFFTPTSAEERNAAELCSQDDLNRPMRQELGLHSPQEMKEQLAKALGNVTAKQEMDRALSDLRLDESEIRPYALRRLRDRIEANLSGLLGPSVAIELVDRHLPYVSDGSISTNEDIHLIENRLEKYQDHLTGLAAELDNLRRFHRQTLQNLPVGVCSFGSDKELLMWNHEMERLTQIPGEQVVGSHLNSLPEPWNELISTFLDNQEADLHKNKVIINQQPRWISLHKTILGDQHSRQDAQVILLEDLTETQMLEQELIHSERLASIGRLAAGVAHEIGNPVTGIACLAQNLKYDTDNPIIHEAGQDILTQTERVTRIVQSLVNFAHSGNHAQQHGAEPVDLYNCADEAINLLRLGKDYQEVTFDNQINSKHIALGDSQRILQVFINLLSNARDASPANGLVILHSQIDGETVNFTVTDHGGGISKEHQETVFEPFFTTKDPGRGTGLGLALVYSIIEDHQGHIAIESPLGGNISYGTRITVQLPLYMEPGEIDSDSEIG